MPADDVTAVVLTIDEPYTPRALQSVAAQRAAVADVVVVRDTVPFHRALNAGAAQVRTPYFVQVDADMVLDPTCCAELRACVADGVGTVIGHLRDALLGRVAGIKLFRTACFADVQCPDSISPDTDFGNAIARRGWTTIYAIRYPSAPADLLHVFGDHAPDYTPRYTFRKYALLGARHRYRRAAASLRTLVGGLHASRHAAARVALIATAYGISQPAEADLLTPHTGSAEWTRLEHFLACGGDEAPVPEALRDWIDLDVRSAWQRGYASGVELYRRQAAAAFAAALQHLADALAHERGTIAWVALVGLCQGLFADEIDDAAAAQAFARFNQVLPSPYRLRLDAAASGGA